MNDTGKIVDQKRVETTEASLIGYIRSLKRPRRLAFEETSLAQWLYLLFQNEVDEQIVCHPGYLGKVPGAKGDFRDGLRLADDLRCNRLIGVFHDDSELRRLRTVVSGYRDITQDLTRTKNRYKALFRAHGIKTPGQTIYSDLKRIKEIPIKVDQFVAKNTFDQIQHLQGIRSEYEKKLTQQAKKHPVIKKLCSVPGIRVIRASTIASLVVAPDRFKNKHKFWSYCMQVKYIEESDGCIYGKRSPYGRRELKGVFDGAAQRVLQGNSSLRREYDKLRSKGITHRNAKKAIARKIAAICLAIMKHNVKYDDKHREKQDRVEKNRV